MQAPDRRRPGVDLAALRLALRLAVAAETYPTEVNGVAMSTAQLVRGLEERGHRLQPMRPRQHAGNSAEVVREQPWLQGLLMPGLPIPRRPELKMGLPAQSALLRCWAGDRPDLVHLATEGPLGWSALQAARRLQLRVTADFRTDFHTYSRHFGIGWLRRPIAAYLRHLHNRAQRTMVLT